MGSDKLLGAILLGIINQVVTPVEILVVTEYDVLTVFFIFPITAIYVLIYIFSNPVYNHIRHSASGTTLCPSVRV